MKKLPEMDSLYQSEYYATAFQKPKHLADLVATSFCYAEPNTILEVGSNDGSFIEYLSKYPEVQKVIGIEPNLHNVKISRSQSHIVYDGYFNEDLATQILDEQGAFDIIFCRHVLEHVPDPVAFLEACIKVLNNDGILVVELPNVDEGFKSSNPVIIWEEHVNYFTNSFLKHFFKALGFSILATRDYVYGGGANAWVLKKTSNPNLALLNSVKNEDEYGQFYSNTQLLAEKTIQLFSQAKSLGQLIVVYGCGPRTSTFLNYMSLAEQVDYFIDDRLDLNGLYPPNGKSKIINFKQFSSISNQQVLMFLGVGAETESKIKRRLETLDIQIEFVSMFHPKPTLQQVEQLIIKSDL